MAMKFSKKGDRGFTSLMGGQRVPKSGPRPDAYGTLDEASSALGMARASARRPRTGEIILNIQKDLLLLGAELATESGRPGEIRLSDHDPACGPAGALPR